MTTLTLYRFDRKRHVPDPHVEDTESGYSREHMTTPAPVKQLTPVEEILERAWGTLTARGLAL